MIYKLVYQNLLSCKFFTWPPHPFKHLHPTCELSIVIHIPLLKHVKVLHKGFCDGELVVVVVVVGITIGLLGFNCSQNLPV